MKRRLCLLFFIGLLLTGCGKNITSDTISEMNEPKHQTEAVLEEDSAVTDSEKTKEAGEDEAYVLEFTATTVDGEEFTSECFSESKLTMINIWATYCNPCLSEMPDLGEIAAYYDSEEFQIIGVVSDVAEGSSEETVSGVKDLIIQTNAHYPHLLLSESLYMNLVGMVDSVPTTFFVNQDGEPLGYVVGARSKEAWEEMIHELLAEME